MPRETMNILQAGARCGVSRRTIYYWLANGKLEYVRTAGGNVRIFVDSLFVKGNVSADGAIGQASEESR